MQGTHSQAGLGVNGAFNETATCCAKGDGPGQAGSRWLNGKQEGTAASFESTDPSVFYTLLSSSTPFKMLFPKCPPTTLMSQITVSQSVSETLHSF